MGLGKVFRLGWIGLEKGGIVSNSILQPGNGVHGVESLRQMIELALKGIREEFDDHRESINDNTCEIEANYELLCRLDAKVDRIQAQLEQLQLSLSSSKPSPVQGIELDGKEKEVFLILYTASDSRPLTYREIADGMRESEFLVRGYITNMIEKGVPVQKRYVNDTAYVSLDASFKDLQAKQNVVRLNQKTVLEFAV